MAKGINGRPKEDVKDKVDFKLVEKYAALGLIDTEIGFLLGITERSVNRYKKDIRFLSALQRGKLDADAKVVESLYRRAIGYSHREDKVFLYRGKPIIVPMEKHYPPDTLACNSWLNNRRRHQWQWTPKPDSGIPDTHIDKLRELVTEAMRDES